LSLWAALTLGGLSACSITHEGPQEGTETGNPPVIDVTRVMLVVGSEKVKIAGAAGAVSPGGSEVKVQCSLTGMIFAARSASDGSFSIDIDASSADIFELRAADASGDTSKASPVYVSRGSAAVHGEKLTCMQRGDLARAQMAAVAETADTACVSDYDCMLRETTTICSDACSEIPVSTRGTTQLEQARTAVANGVCRTFEADGCSILALPCVPPIPGGARCIDRRCVLGPASTSPGVTVTGCTEPFDPGPDAGAFTRYWYSSQARACLARSYGGSGGNANRYETRAACEAACKPAVLSCDAPRVAANVCLEGGLAGGCATRGMACAAPCMVTGPCSDVLGNWCAAGYCDATSPD
jgi:hypothetical protein